MGRVLQQTEQLLVVERTWRCVEEPFLYDHSIGHVGYPPGEVSDSLQASWLPLMPMMLLVEAAAEAASRLCPGLHVVGLRDIRSRAFIPLTDEDPPTLRLTAERVNEQIIKVSVQKEGAAAGPPLFEVRVLMAKQFPHPPQPPLAPLQKERPPVLSAERMYAEVMFHGPAFRVVEALVASGEDGVDARLKPPDAEAGWTCEPLLMDSFPQLVNYWAYERIDARFWGFIFQVGQVDFYRPLWSVRGSILARVRVQPLNAELLSAEAVYSDSSGTPCMRVSDMLNRRRDAPEPVFAFVCDPERRGMSEELPFVSDDVSVFAEGSLAVLEPEVYRSTCERLTHTRRERQELEKLPAPARSQAAATRIAAKDALRAWLRRADGRLVRPSELELTSLPGGFVATSGKTSVSISTATHGSLAYAAVGKPQPGFARVGLATRPMAEQGITAADEALLEACALGAVQSALSGALAETEATVVHRNRQRVHVRVADSAVQRLRLPASVFEVEWMARSDHWVGLCTGRPA